MLIASRSNNGDTRIPTRHLQLYVECWRKSCICLNICRASNVLAKQVSFELLVARRQKTLGLPNESMRT